MLKRIFEDLVSEDSKENIFQEGQEKSVSRVEQVDTSPKW